MDYVNNKWVPLEVPGFPGFYYDVKGLYAINLDGEIILQKTGEVIRSLNFSPEGFRANKDTYIRHYVRNDAGKVIWFSAAVKTVLYAAMFGPGPSRVFTCLTSEVGQLTKTPYPTALELHRDINPGTVNSSTQRRISMGQPVNGIQYYDVFDLPDNERRALLQSWINRQKELYGVKDDVQTTMQ